MDGIPFCRIAGFAWIILLIFNSRTLAAGFIVNSQGAKAAAQGDAFTAQADDPSAIYYNPAGLAQLQGTQISAGVYAVFPDFQFQGISDHQQMNDPSYIPHFYGATDLGLANWRFGLGINDVFGLNEDWGDTGPLSRFVTNADLSILSIAPTVSYRVDEHLSLGFGLNVYAGDVELNNKIPFPGSTDSSIRVKGSDTAVGFTAGTLWSINPRHSIGLVYRSPFEMNFDGSSKIYRAGQSPIGPSDTRERLDLPQIVTAGYAYRPTERLTLEFDVQWTNWDTLNQAAITSNDPIFSSLPPIRFEYHDSFAYRLGVQYQLDPAWAIRGGYIYSESSTPDKTFSPLVVDLNSHIFTAGIGYSKPHWGWDLAYRLILGNPRDIDQSVNTPPGRYTDLTHALLLTVTWKF